jgi:hypothetical protein
MTKARPHSHSQMEEQAQQSFVISDNILQLSFIKYDFVLDTCVQPDFEPQMCAEIWLSSGTGSNSLKPVLGNVAEIVDQLNDFHSIYLRTYVSITRA